MSGFKCQFTDIVLVAKEKEKYTICQLMKLVIRDYITKKATLIFNFSLFLLIS